MKIEHTKMGDTLRQQDKTKIWMIYALTSFVLTGVIPPILPYYGYSLTQLIAAGILLSLCLFPTAYYWSKREEGTPSFPLICLAYGLQFALPIYTRDAVIMLAGGVNAGLNDEDVIAALSLAILGVIGLGIGYYGLQASRPAKFLPSIALPLDDKKAVVFSLIMGLGIPLANSFELITSDIQFSSITRVLLNQVLVAIAILSGLVYSGKGGRWHKVLLFGLTGLATVRGISTSFLEHAVMPFAVLLMMRWNSTKRMPVAVIAGSLFLIVFLSPVKQDYRMALSRATTSDAETGYSAIERTVYWFASAAEHWIDALSGQRSISDSADSASSRLDLIHQFAHVYSMTPSVVPYQYGTTYSYFAIGLIPRVIWPDKPEAGNANYFFAVNYGITTEEGAMRSTFGMSLLAESFINFGWAGVSLLMLMQGAFLCVLREMFSGSRSALGGQAIFVSFFVYFLNGLGSSAEIIFGNIFQSMLLSVAILWWVRKKTPPPIMQERFGLGISPTK